MLHDQVPVEEEGLESWNASMLDHAWLGLHEWKKRATGEAPAILCWRQLWCAAVPCGLVDCEWVGKVWHTRHVYAQWS